MINIEKLTYNEYQRNFPERCNKYVQDYLKTKPKGLNWCTNEYFIKLYEHCLTLKTNEQKYKVFYLIDYLEALLKTDLD